MFGGKVSVSHRPSSQLRSWPVDNGGQPSSSFVLGNVRVLVEGVEHILAGSEKEVDGLDGGRTKEAVWNSERQFPVRDLVWR